MFVHPGGEILELVPEMPPRFRIRVRIEEELGQLTVTDVKSSTHTSRRGVEKVCYILPLSIEKRRQLIELPGQVVSHAVTQREHQTLLR